MDVRSDPHRIGAVLLTVAVLAVGGCASSDDPDPTDGSAAPSPTVSVPSEGSPTPSGAAGLVTADGLAPAPVDDDVLETYALGALVVGMTLEEAEATGLVLWDVQTDRPSGFLYRPSRDVFVGGNDEKGITGFLVKTDTYRTPAGIAVGMGLADVQQAYGDAVDEVSDESGAKYYLVRDGDFGYYFQPDPQQPEDDTITVIIAGDWWVVSGHKPYLPFIG